jgi:hypothetical protein
MRVSILLTGLLLASAATASENLEDLSWLAGHWITADGAAEEQWLEPRGGTMTGQFRWIFPNGNQVLEYLVIEQTDEDIIFRFKHYGTDFVPWEKDEPNTYRLTELAEDSVTFELISDNPKVPRRYRYQVTGDTLTFTGERSDAPEPLVIEFRRQ